MLLTYGSELPLLICTRVLAASDATRSAAVDAAVADAGDMDWAESEDDGGDDEETLDADEQAAAAEGVNIKACLGALCRTNYVRTWAQWRMVHDSTSLSVVNGVVH